MGSRPLNRRLAVAGGLLLSSLAPVAGAAGTATLYCCQDAGGRKVCGDSLPSQCIGRNYTIKTDAGTRQVEGMLTPEQRAQREEEAKRRKQEEAAQKEQRRLDQALLSTYASEKDIDQARERAEKDLVAQINRAEAKIAEVATRRKKLEKDAEFYKNKPLPDEIRRGLKDIEVETKVQNELIEGKKKDLDNLRAKFDAEKQRYREVSQSRVGPR